MKSFVTSLDQVPEQYRGLYKEVDGGFLLQVEPVNGYALENVNGLKNALQTKTIELQDAKNKIAEMGELDLDKLKKDSENWNKVKDLDPEEQAAKKVRDAIRVRDEAHQKELNKYVDREKSLIDKLKSSGLESVKTAIAKAGGRPEWAMDYLRNAVKVELNDDLEPVTSFMSEDGLTPLVEYDAQGKEIPFSVDKFVEKMQNSDTYGGIFKTPATGGNGGQPNYEGGQSGKPKVISADQANDYIEELAEGKVVVGE
jgi:FtsZ-binding cell division protein ZapB